MKTDRELLELAAKAAGIKIERRADGRTFRKEKGFPFSWNPLDDDGDALRLLHIIYRKSNVDDWIRIYDNLWGGSLEDTRRAIVRAAAAIGEGME